MELQSKYKGEALAFDKHGEFNNPTYGMGNGILFINGETIFSNYN